MEKTDASEENEQVGEIPVFDLFKTPAKFQSKSSNNKSKKKTPKRKNEEVIDSPKRPRTPSGHVLSSSVGELKTILFKNSEKRRQVETENPFKIAAELQHDQALYATQCSERPAKVLMRIQPSVAAQTIQNLNMKIDETKTVNKQGANANDSSVRNEDQTDEEAELPKQQKQADIKDADDEDATPNTMDICTVVQMLQQLKIDLKGEIAQEVKNELKGLKTVLIGDEENPPLFDYQQTSNDMASMKARLQVCEAKERMMVDAMAGMSERIHELQQKLDIVDIEKSQKMIVLSGFEGDESDKKTCRFQLEAFFVDKLNVEVMIEDFYHIGKATPKDIIISLLSAHQKRLIFQNIKQISHLRNSHGKKYTIRDHVTSKQMEKRKRSQQIADLIAQDDESDQIPVSTEKGMIFVGDDVYKRCVNPPDPTRVLQLPLSRLNEIMATQLNRAPAISVNGNTFTAYSVNTAKYKIINDAYMKLRLNHADAKHIVCAWHFPSPKMYESSDDGDHGAGHHILRVMRDNKITHTAVYIVRQGSTKLHDGRLEQYTNALVEVINRFLMNLITKKEQQIKICSESSAQYNTYANAVRSGNKRGTVHRRGRGGRGSRRGGRGGRGRGGGGRGGHRQSYNEPSNRNEQAEVYIPKIPPRSEQNDVRK